MIAIIGAGALGLMLANILEKNKIKYVIFNKGKVGRKILASGNGRCNISNLNYSDRAYHNNPLAKKIVEANQNDLLKLFKELNIYTKSDSEGRMYPISESSLSVLNLLTKNIKSDIIDDEITKISLKADEIYLNDSLGPFSKLVIATGSNASFKKPYLSTNYINSLGVKFNEFKPSLIGFRTNKSLKEISGCRSKCNASLYINNKLIHSEDGEVMFKDQGISGICIMNLSSYYNNYKDNSNAYIKLNLSDIDYPSYESILQPKLYNYVMNNKIDIHNMIIKISGVYDMEFAQVGHGGIDLSEINDNLRLKKYNNIYAGGEIIDIDALCGGYNLMLAFTCAIAIGKDIINEISNK